MTFLRLLLGSLCLWGCTSPSVDEVVVKHRAEVERTFAALSALDKQVQSAGEMSEAQVERPQVPLFLEKPDSDEDNAIFVYAEDLAGSSDAVQVRTIDSLPLMHCRSLLKEGKAFKSTVVSPSIAKGYLSACARLRFALVIRTRELKLPQEARGENQFVSGVYRADVLVFDLLSGKSLGGFPVEAKNKPEVTVLSGENQPQRLLVNLEGTFYEALRSAARTAFPGSLPRQ